MKDLDVKTLPLDTKVIIEASAGTGKTYTIGLIVIRLLLEKLIPIEKIVLITFTDAASFELKKNTSEKIRDAYEIWKNGLKDNDKQNILIEIIENAKKENKQLKEANLLDAIARIDEMPVYTIHGFCKKMLSEFAFETGNFEEKEVVTNTDDVIERVAADFWRENIKDKEMSIELSLDNLISVAKIVLSHPMALITGDKIDDSNLKDKALQYSIAHKFAREIRQRFREEKHKLKIIDFNDMIENCHNAVLNDNKNNNVLLNAVNTRYEAIMVDEFQDTDKVQYEIFDYLFKNKPFFMIGDPKQAIYRFRGGDIVAYKSARESAKIHQYSMNTNYRSENTILDAMNVFFANKSFENKMGKGIDYYQVACGKPELISIQKEKDNWYKPFIIWKGKPQENKDNFAPRVQTAVISEIKRLLNSEKIQPENITILLSTNDDCLRYKHALSKEGIYAIYSGGNVFTSDAAEFLKILVNAVYYSNRTGFVRAFLTHEFIGYEPNDINDNIFILWTNILLEAKAEWNKSGIMHCIDYILTKQKLWNKIAANNNGKRNIRNIRQILEILNKEESDIGNIPEKIIICLINYCSEQSKSEDTKERLETDEKALKIMTIHSSKGLQFDIVFIPDISRKPKSHKFPHTYMYYKDDKKYIAFVAESKNGEKELNNDAENEENARLLYVAITRAKYRVYIAYNPCYSRSKSYLRDIFDQFCNQNNNFNNIQIEELDKVLEKNKNYKFKTKITETEKQAKKFSLNIEPAWNKTSFSGIAQNLQHPEYYSKVKLPENEPPAGKRMGTLLHEIFEKLDFSAKNRENELSEIVTKKFSIYKEFSGEEGGKRIKWIKDKVNIILDKDLGNSIKLSDIENQDKISELHFFMSSGNIDLKKIKNILGDKILDFENGNLIAKYLNGAIDLVFLGKDGKYYILDWKSNILNDYSRKSMEEEAMLPHGYHLQYYIYTVALKRWLELTHAGFDFKLNFGGVYYIFIRGVTADRDKDGIFFADSKEIADSIEELDKCFGRRI